MLLGNNRSIEVTPTITNGAYSAGDVVGGLLEFDFSNAGNGGILGNIYIDDAGNLKAPGTLYLFNDAPTTIADNAVFASALVIADIKKRIRTQPIAAGDYDTLNSLAHAEFLAINQIFSSMKIYGYFVCSGTPSYTATNQLTFRLSVSLNS